MTMSPETYRQRLLEGCGPSPPALGDLPALPARAWFRPPPPHKPVGLPDLYDMGVRAGHGETRAYLERRIAAYDAELEFARLRLAQVSTELGDRLVRAVGDLEEARLVHDRHERELQEAVEQARNRIAELEGSRFWRITAPLRALVHRGKLAVRYLRRLSRQRHALAPRLATARQIAKDEGVLELVRRVHGKLSVRGAAQGIRRRPGLESAIAPLHVPTSDAPRVSVIVPAYGQDLHTFTCLKALAGEAEAVPLEVIVMDDASPVPVAHALAGVTGVRFERNASNLGFLGNCNRGAALARGEYLLLLNNDAAVAPGAIAALLAIFERFPDAGAAGAKLVYPDGRLQEAGGIVWRDASGWNYGRGGDPANPEFSYVREADYCSAACLLVPRRLFAELGGFDERYAPAYYEDTDLCFRIRETGRRVYYQPAAEAVHFEGASHGTDLSTGPKRHQVENQARFLERWKPRLEGHRVNGSAPRLERERGARRRVLFVEACMLTPDQDSGSLRTWRLVEIMQSMGCKVTFVAANLERREPYVGELQQMGVEVLHAPFVRSVDELIRDRGAEFDLIVLARYYIATRYVEAVRRHAPRALLVFDTIDLHYLRNRRLAELEGSAALAQGAEAIHRQEIDCIRASDVTWVVSEVERGILAREIPSARVMVLTNIHRPVGVVRPFAGRDGLLFVGGFRHPPNVDAALYLAREIVPLLAERLPGVTTYVIGSNPPKAVAELSAPGLEVVGYVPEIEPWLARCRVSVSPLRYGAGVKGKVNQAMSHGLPVVATAASVEGMHLVEGEEVLVADDPVAFADAVARAYCDEALWSRLSRGGLANVERHFGPRLAAGALEETFAVLDRRRAVTSAAPAARAAA